MKLFSRQLERQIGKEARQQIRASKGLRREYSTFRTTWRSRLNHNRNAASVVIVIVWISLAFLYAVNNNPGSASLVAAVAIPCYSIGTALVRGEKFRSRVLASMERILFLHLPVTDDEFLIWEWQQFLKSWAKGLLVFIPAFAFFASGNSGWNWTRACVALGCCVLQIGVALTLSLMVLATQPRWAKLVIAAPFYLLIPLAVWQPELIARTLVVPLGILPVGWLPFALSQQRIWTQYLLLWPILAAAAFAALAVVFARRLRLVLLAELAQHSEFRTPNLETETETSEAKEVREELPPPETTAVAPETLDSVLAQRRVLDRSYLAPMNLASAGWIERLVSHFLSAEDWRALEFMAGGTLPQWSKQFKTGLVIAAVGLGVTAVTWLPVWTGFAGVILASIVAAPLGGGRWGAFARALRSGFAVPIYIAAPIAFSRIWSVVMKVNLLRIALWAPIVILYGAVLAWRIGEEPLNGAIDAARAVLALALLQPVMLLGRYSQGTNDSRRLTWQILVALPIALLFVAAFLAALFVFYIASAVWAQILAVVGMALSSLLLYSGYMLLLTRGKIDLLSSPSG